MIVLWSDYVSPYAFVAKAGASGVFGVPTFVFDGELFWGGDRIGLLRERLDEKGVKRRSASG